TVEDVTNDATSLDDRRTDLELHVDGELELRLLADEADHTELVRVLRDRLVVQGEAPGLTPPHPSLLREEVGPDAVTGIVVERHLVLDQPGRPRRAQGAEVRSERPHRGERARQLALVQASRPTRVRAHRERRHTTRRPAERDDAPTT